MNFLSHFFFDQHHPSSEFVIGLATPDLLAIFDKNHRLRPAQVRKMQEKMGEESAFLQGIQRHFQADALFHSSAFFREESLLIPQLLREYFPQAELKRSYFWGHILFELILDKMLLRRDAALAEKYYERLRPLNLKAISAETEALLDFALPGYEAFLGRYVESRQMQNYEKSDYIPRVAARILELVQINTEGILGTQEFLVFLERYEAEKEGSLSEWVTYMSKHLS